ncbi:MAG: cytochrome c oxidase subunit 3 [Pirellulaceae bacterium]|nr:cytochrome c oxidase subunit 3 [Pirellulaceae bacterium]
MRQRTGLVICLAITLGCAAIFLGVKAIEYSHKWDIGLLPAGFYIPQSGHAAEHHEGLSKWLIYFSVLPGVCAIGFAGWYALALVKKDKATAEIAGPFLATALCYFVGVGIGMFFQAQEDAELAAAAHTVAGEEIAAHGHDVAHDAADAKVASGDQHAHNAPASGEHKSEVHSMASADFQPGESTDQDVDQQGRAGLFFSIYYCMTGVHAVHILGGMLVLGWLLIRATKDHFNEQYFGPVDYVGLYWHLVDLIWIYLFPLLYLIK